MSKHNIYTAEVRAEVIRRVKAGEGLAKIADELGIPKSTMRSWPVVAKANRENKTVRIPAVKGSIREQSPPTPPEATFKRPEEKLQKINEFIEGLELLIAGYRELIRERDAWKAQADSWRDQALNVKEQMEKLVQNLDKR